MADVQLTVDQRVVTGKRVKSLRKQGLMPAHLYGRGTESLTIQTETSNIVHLLRTAGRNAIIDLMVNGEGEPRPVVLRGIQRNPITDELVHVDFYQISLTETLRADVALHFTGEAPAVQVFSGVLLHSIDHITVEALPRAIPERIEVDISGLEELESALFVRDLPIPGDVEVLTDLDMMVVKVGTPRLAAADEEEAAAAELAAAEAAAAEGGEEGAAPAEGEAGAAAAEESSES
jgi:large subunit ribosomal protein L25